MNTIFSYLFVFGLIYTSRAAAAQNTNETYTPITEYTCIKSGEFECVPETKCSKPPPAILWAVCGQEQGTGIQKVCCLKASVRITRQAKAPSAKDPYHVAQQKCTEYSAARFENKVLSSPDNKSSSTKRVLTCAGSRNMSDHAGILANLNEFPQMALVGYNNKSDRPNDTHWACGGTLISDKYVLTSAHCIKYDKDEANWVRFGELLVDDHNDGAQPQDFRIKKRILHPNYTNSLVNFDIMLLELEKAVKFTPFVRPVCLYTSPEVPADLQNKVFVSEWSIDDAIRSNDTGLAKVQMTVFNDTKCIAHYKGENRLAKGYDPTTMICAGDKTTVRDLCIGGAGGALQVPISDWNCMYSQIGITSFGSLVCRHNDGPDYGIYTKIYPFIPWIQSIVWP